MRIETTQQATSLHVLQPSATKRVSRFFGVVLGALAITAASSASLAQTWPGDKPIRMVIPFPPGGTSDVLGRFWAQKLSAALGTSVVVDNRPGAGTTIAAALVAKAPADGYTLYFTDVTTHAINATLYKRLPYSVEKDFTPVALVASSPLVFVVPAALPVNNMAEFISMVKAKPGQYSYASSGNGAILHLATEAMKAASGMDIVHVPYKGSAEATTATLSGQTAASFATVPAAVPHVAAGRFKALGVTSPVRNEAFPNVPPIGDTIPNYNILLYSGILGPAGMPTEVVNRINSEVSRIMKEPETRTFYTRSGAEAVDMKPAEFSAQLTRLVASMGQVVKQSAATID
jgi:tripartite-type tricarboxylate transporter receptor subunit TctC